MVKLYVNKYKKIFSPKFVDIYKKKRPFRSLKFNKTTRCGILYFHSIPNKEDLNLQLSIGKEKIVTKGLFKIKKKIVDEIKTIPIKEKMAILIRNDTLFKFKMNNRTLSEPIEILEFNLNCGEDSRNTLFSN